MKQTFVAGALVALLGGCAAEVEVQETAAPEASVASAALTVEECGAQQRECFADNPLFGLLTCPLQYTECVATADNGLPAQVVSTASAASECANDLLSCELDASSPSEALACVEDGAMCVASAVDITLPNIVTGTRDCVVDSVSCLEEAATLQEVAACAEGLEVCAVDQVSSVLPEGLGEILTDVNSCQLDLSTCVTEAQSPSELTRCGEADLACVADTVGVEVDVTLASDAVACAEDGAQCVLGSESLSDVAACGEELVQCAAAPIVEELTCEQQWTQCIAENPLFGFFSCGRELAECTD